MPQNREQIREELNPRTLEANFGPTVRTLYTIMSGNYLKKNLRKCRLLYFASLGSSLGLKCVAENDVRT